MKNSTNCEIFAGFTGELISGMERQGRFQNSKFLLDNFSGHKTQYVLDLALKYVTYFYLPELSPQFNPIDLLWGYF
jgi:hypothetical protein